MTDIGQYKSGIRWRLYRKFMLTNLPGFDHVYLSAFRSVFYTGPSWEDEAFGLFMIFELLVNHLNQCPPSMISAQVALKC